MADSDWEDIEDEAPAAALVPRGAHVARSNEAAADLPEGFTRVPMGAVPRRGTALPHPGDRASYWKDCTIITMTDDSAAMRNAVRNTFPEAIVVHGMCAVHCFTNWKLHKRGDFRDFDKNASDMNKDFEKYKTSPWRPLVPILRRKMVAKWYGYRERIVADKWFNQWATTKHTRVEMNEFGFFQGGIPATNNSAESQNKSDKVASNWTRFRTVNFVHQMVREISGRSHRDTLFCPALNKDCATRKFYKMVKEIVDKNESGMPTCLNVWFTYSGGPAAVPKGSLLVATTSFIDGELPI